jgi:hypothetical protein
MSKNNLKINKYNKTTAKSWLCGIFLYVSLWLLVSLDFLNKIPEWWLKQQKFIFSLFWKPWRSRSRCPPIRSLVKAPFLASLHLIAKRELTPSGVFPYKDTNSIRSGSHPSDPMLL